MNKIVLSAELFRNEFNFRLSSLAESFLKFIKSKYDLGKPTYISDIKKSFGYKTHSMVSRYLTRLKNLGLIKKSVEKADSSWKKKIEINEKLQYLEQPQDISIDWTTVEDQFGNIISYVLKIPNIYIDPNNPDINCTFSEGDSFLIRYNSPVERGVSIGIGKMYLENKPVNPTVPKAEIVLINASSTAEYGEFMTPYNYNITLSLTPFDTEFMGTYKAVKFDLNLSVLASYTNDSYIDFSNLLITSYDPSYELTVDQIIVQKVSDEPVDLFEFTYERVWQYSQLEEFISGTDPSKDNYTLSLEEEPLFYNDANQAKWLEHLKIYDENYNYYSAGISGDEYQLLWSSITHNFSWNKGFNRFQEYWGMEIELPHMVAPNTTLFFEYCTDDSWNNSIDLYYENIDFNTLEITYDYEYWLTPRYEEWYGEIIENSDFDYEFTQYYSESFTVFNNASEYSHIFEIDYDFNQDFTNLSLFKVIGLYANFTDKQIESDEVNYEVSFDISNKNVTIRDLNPNDGLLNAFNSITVILNFTFGPISTSSQVFLSQYFNQTYLADAEDTFYDFLSISFDYSIIAGEYLFVEDSQTITSGYSSFESINFTRNTDISEDKGLIGYENSTLFTHFELFEDPFNVIYVADIDMDNNIDYKHEMDVDKDGRIDITRFGIDDEENPNEIIWYAVVQDYESTQTLVNMSLGKVQSTKWFDLDDRDFSTYQSSFSINPLDWLVSLGNTIMPNMDFWARKFVQQQHYESQEITSKFYSVRIDRDRDGYAEQEISYESNEITIDYEITKCESAIIAAKPMNMLIAIADYVAKSWNAFFAGNREDPIFNDALTEVILGNSTLLYSKFDDITASILSSTYNKYTKNTTTSYQVRQMNEFVTISDWEENEIVETRIYSDDFNADNTQTSLWTTISDSETGQLIEVPAHLYPSRFSEPKVWGEDNVSIGLDSLTVIIEGEVVDSTNYYEQQVKIAIPNRFSAFDDSFKGDKSDAKGDVTFEVIGVLITPQDGVYYTSDKKAFIARTAKTDGKYLFYDSDQNGFYETVYILRPVPDGNEAYTVISIGFNYDGEHDFTPYTKTEFTDNEPETDLEEFYRVNKIFGANWMYHFNELENNELLFPSGDYDGYEQKDSLFEIYKITNTFNYFPELFYEIRHKTYNTAWEIHNENLVRDAIEQVSMMVTGSIVSEIVHWATTAAITASTLGWGAPAAEIIGRLAGAGAFFAVYTLLSKISIDIKMHQAESQERAQIFYAENAERREPKSLNQRSELDRILGDSMFAALMGHPGAYYTTIRGGEIGSDYIAEAIASPPNDLRFFSSANAYGTLAYVTEGIFTGNPDLMSGLDFDDLNLDYLLLNSELNSYNDQPYYAYQPGDGYVSPTHNLLYNEYRLNTIGYLQLAIDQATGGSLDTVKLESVYNDEYGYCMPRYVFVDKDTEFNDLILPQSALYQPLVLSKERYDDLPSKPAEGQIFVDVKSQFATESDGIDAYNMSIFEKEKDYYAKIPLANARFLYPITSVTITPINKEVTIGYMGQYPNIVEYEIVEESAIHPFSLDLVEGTDYELKGGNLYFKKPIDNFLYQNADAYKAIGGENNVFYRVQINFERVVAADPNGPDYDKNMKLALQQATAHILQDFVNIHTHAQVAASMTAEIGYTAEMTAISTATSVALIAIGGWAIQGVKGYFQEAGKIFTKAQLIAQVATDVGKRVVKGVIEEVFEEIAIDSLIEAFAENWVASHGGTADMGYWLSSSLTSLRETKSVMQHQSGSSSTGALGLSTWVAQSQALALQERGRQLSRAELFAQYKAEQQSNQWQSAEQISAFKKLTNSKAFKILGLAIPSMYFGGFALIGAIQIATAFGSKIINAPKTISQYRTTIHAIKEGVRQAAPIKRMAKAAGVNPQIMLKQMQKLTKYGVPSTRTVARVNPNPRLGIDISVNDYVNSKLEPINPALAYAPITSTVTYATAQSVANLEAQMELVKYKMRTIEILDKIRELSFEIEQTSKEDSKRFVVEIDASELPIDYRSFKFYIVGTPPETRFIDIPLPIDVSLIEAKLLLKNRFRYDIELLLDGQILSSENSYKDLELSNDMKLKLISDLSDSPIALIGAQMGARPAENWENDLQRLFDNYDIRDSDIKDLAKEFTKNFYRSMRDNPDNFLDVFNRKEFFTEFLPELKTLLDLTLVKFDPSNFELFETSLLFMGLQSAAKLGFTSDQEKQLKSEIKKIAENIESIYQDSKNRFLSEPGKYKDPDTVIRQSIMIGIMKLAYDTPIKISGAIPYKIGNTDEIYNLLMENLKTFKKTSIHITREFITLCVLECVTHTYSFNPRKFYHLTGLDSGGQLETFTETTIIPLQILWYLQRNYKIISGPEDIVKHNIDMRFVKNKRFGLGNYEDFRDENRFDNGRWFYQKDSQYVLSYTPNKNTMEFSNSRVIDIIQNIYRNVYETHNLIIKDSNLTPENLISEILLIAPFFSQETIYNTLTDFIKNFVKKLSKGVDLGTFPWSETGKESKFSISDGHKYNKIQEINNKLGSRNNYDDFIQYKNDFENEFAYDKDIFIRDLAIDNQAKLKDYWGTTYNSKGQSSYCLILEGSSRMYINTGDKLYIKNIENFLDKTDGLKGINVQRDETGNSFIAEATILGFKFDIDSKGDQNLKYRLFSQKKIQSGELLDDGWVLGNPRIKEVYYDENGNIRIEVKNIFPPVPFTYLDNNLLAGRFGEFESFEGIFQLKDNGELWFMEKSLLDELLLKDNQNNLIYGIKPLFYEVTRFGNSYHIIGTVTHITTMKLKFDIDSSYVPKRFRALKILSKPKGKSKSLNYLPFLRTFPIDLMWKNTDDILKEKILENIFKLVQAQVDVKGTATKISIPNKVLRILNSYIDKNGVLHKGIGYKELSYIFKTLVKEKSFDLCFNSFKHVQGETPIQDIEHLMFNRDQSQKQWFKTLLEIFQSYVLPSQQELDSLSPNLRDLVKVIKNELFGSDGINKFKDFMFSEDDEMLQFGDNIDEILATQLFNSFIKIFGRFTFAKVTTSSMFINNDYTIDFVSTAWTSFTQAFKNNRLFLDEAKVSGRTTPPKVATYVTAKSFVLNTILFGPSMSLKVKYGINDNYKDFNLDTQPIPTDYLKPTFKRLNDVIKDAYSLYEDASKIDEYIHNYYISLYNLIWQDWGLKTDYEMKLEYDKLYGKKLFYQETLNLYLVNLKSIEDVNKREAFTQIIQEDLYRNIYYGTSEKNTAFRKKIIEFLKTGGEGNDKKGVEIFLSGQNPLKYNGINFRSLTLDKGDYIRLYKLGFIEIIQNAFDNIYVEKDPCLSISLILSKLQEPITAYGSFLKSSALKYGIQGKKIYIIPTISTINGYGHPRVVKNRFIELFSKEVFINNKPFKCLILDGTDMQKFNEEYKYVIRGLLEGFLTVVTLAASENEIDGNIHLTDISGISAVNIIQGALTPEQLHFTASSSYYSLEEINFYDIEFYNKNYENEEYPGNVVDIMNLFKQYNLPTIPGTRIEDWTAEWKFHWITDFFNNND